MNTKELLLAQLTTLHATMMEVDKNDQKLNMFTWVRNLYGTEENHWCGTVACVCGWQSLGNLDNFPTAKDWVEGWREAADDNKYPEGTARRVSDDLDDSCCEVFGDSPLVESIYDGYTERRRGHAEASELFNAAELNHPHLTGEPSALEAADYIALCIEKVKSYE